MVPKTLCVTATLLWLASATVAFGQGLQTPERAIPGHYIVVLNDNQAGQASIAAIAADLARQYGGRVEHLYEHSIHGFAVEMSAARAAALASHPRVAYIEQDSERVIVDTQTGAVWGLDRIDQRDRPLNDTYTYETIASNVNVYVIDTGIRATHVEFGGRVAGGYTSIGDGNGTNDCNGHGTHVSGTIGGTTYGVAKAATLYPVRVLGCNGSGSTSGVIAGVDWVTGNRVLPAVANMSLGGGASTALDDAVRRSIAAGVTYAIAAGNSTADACAYSPARVSEALTVGSSTSGDARSSFSNYGTCVDLFAPGSSITSAWATSDTAINTISGTSMATPHVAGVAALYLANDPSASPSTVHAAVVDNASVDKLSNVGAGSPNRLLYSIFGSVPVDAPPSAAFTYSCTGLTCTFDGGGSTDDQGITGYFWTFGDGQSDGSGPIVTHTYASGGTFTVQLTVTDTANQTNVASNSVMVSSGGAPCTGCEQYTGTLPGTGSLEYQPNNSYYFSAVTGVHRGWLQGPSTANFDLYLQKWNGSRWVIVAWATNPAPSEQIAYTGTAGYYSWIIYAYSGSGAYTFWLQRP